MKILIFIDWFLPGTKSGGPVRSIANLIDHLGNEFEFLVVTRDKDYCDTKSYENIQSDAWNKLGENLSVFYISDNNLNYRFLKKLVASTLFDVAYINGIYSWFFSILPVILLRHSKKSVIIAARGMLNPQAFSVRPKKKKFFLFWMNLMSFYKNIEFHATNEDEQNFIEKAIKKYKIIKVAPNLPRKLANTFYTGKEKKDLIKFISVARVAREKGTLTALNAFYHIKTHKVVIYDIYGPIYDMEYWDKCLEVIKILPKNIQVNYKGTVNSEKVPSLMRGYHFFLMPSEGENYGHGIVEAFSAGCPVIISNKTPWSDLENKNIGWDLSVDNLEKLVSAIKAAIKMNEMVFQNWSQKAYLYSKQIVGDAKILQASKELFKKSN